MERRERKKDLSTNMNHEAAMDSFLDKLGLYRKPIAKDGSCLFRAVAEQIFNCQAEHTRVRKECIEYMKKNKDRFEAFVEGPFDHHLYNMRSQKEWAGQVEIQALSMMYKCDFLVYKDINSVPIKATENDYAKKIILCYSNGNHYDSIYPYSYKYSLALCQSVVFELLYGQVFPFLMKKDAENKATSPTDSTDRQNDFGENTVVNGYGTGSENGDENDGWTTVKSKKQGKMLTKNQKNVEQSFSEQAPLSPALSKLNWEVMRSIDPDSYRNIELEVWEESRKEQQHKDQAVAATFQFRKGDRCQVKHPVDEKFYLAIIDDVFDEKCKIWIPELKERKTMPFSRLKPKEQNANSGYRDLSGYYRKQESSQDNTSSRGGDDQKGGNRRRKSNRNKKGNFGDGNEKGQQEMSMQDDPSGRPRGDNKNRRRRNNSNTARTKEEKNEFNQREEGNSSQNQGSVEVSAFPALPKRDDQTEKTKTDSDNNPDPATFWRKRRQVEQMEKTTKEDTVLNSTLTAEKNLPGEESESNVKDDIVESQVENVENEWSESVPEKMPGELAQDFPHEMSEKTPPKGPKEIRQELQQELSKEIPQEIPEEIPEKIPEEPKVTPVITEKRVNWQDLNNDIRTNYDEKMDRNINEQTNEQTTKPIYMNNRPPLKETVIEIEDEDSITEEQSYNSMNQVLFDAPKNFEILKNPGRQEVQVEPPGESSSTFSRNVEPETAVVENGPTVEQVINERKETPVFQMTNHTVQGNDANPLVSHNENEQERDVSPTATPDHGNRHPINPATVQNEILNGNITYSTDPEGKDLHKDMEIVRHLYNYGIYMYQYFNNVGGVFPGNAPISPMYPVMNPNAMYAMQQSYQNRAMMMPQNMYPQMQQPTHNENQQSPGEETRENNDNPGFKPSISLHQSPSYHTSHAMAQQAMFNMNYGQMFATGGRPLYSNYNILPPQRPAFSRYSLNKVGFNRQTGRKYNSRYTRNDNQSNVKLHNLQTGYGQYPKEAE